jgi:polyhydroxybutyrate depolymerase
MALRLSFGAGDAIRLALFCVLAAATLAGAAAEPRQLDVGGQLRTFLLERPAQRDPRPTIVMLHGGGSSPAEEMALSGLAELGSQEGFVTIFPEGRGRLWNFFPPGTENLQYMRFLDQRGGLPDDVAFIRAVLAHLVEHAISDPARIYVGGRSVGGAMALRLVCLDAERFAAAALLVSTMPEVIGAHCRPSRPMPLLTINGTEDRVLPYRGERGRQGYILWPIPRLVSFFRDLGGCTGEAERDAPADAALHNVEIERWAQCAGGAVVHYRIVHGGHSVPRELNEARVLWDFFRDKTR